MVADKRFIPNLWRNKRNNIKAKEGEQLLSASDYQGYGFSLDEIKGLSIDKIREINAKILAEDDNASNHAEFDPKKLILTN